MIRRRILFVITALIAVMTAIFVFKEPSPDSDLNIFLRCDDGISGTLSIIPLVPDCKGRQIKESFDVEVACENEPLEYSHYRGRVGVLFTLERKSGEITRLTSEYGSDILWENHLGFTVMIKILNAPPFLANDSL